MSLNKPSKELLLDLVNQTWDKNYAVDAVVFSDLEIQPYDAQRNTGATIDSAIGDTPLAEPKKIYYDRVVLGDLQNFRLGADTPISIEDEGQVSTEDLLDAINTALDTQMDATDIVVEDLPTDGDYPRGVVVKANPTSWVFIGQLSVVLTDPTP